MGVLLSWHESCWKGTNRERKGEDEGQPRLETNSGNYCSEATAAGRCRRWLPLPPVSAEHQAAAPEALVNSIPTETASFPSLDLRFFLRVQVVKSAHDLCFWRGQSQSEGRAYTAHCCGGAAAFSAGLSPALPLERAKLGGTI